MNRAKVVLQLVVVTVLAADGVVKIAEAVRTDHNVGQQALLAGIRFCIISIVVYRLLNSRKVNGNSHVA